MYIMGYIILSKQQYALDVVLEGTALLSTVNDYDWTMNAVSLCDLPFPFPLARKRKDGWLSKKQKQKTHKEKTSFRFRSRLM